MRASLLLELLPTVVVLVGAAGGLVHQVEKAAFGGRGLVVRAWGWRLSVKHFNGHALMVSGKVTHLITVLRLVEENPGSAGVISRGSELPALDPAVDGVAANAETSGSFRH